jgi:DHA2 family multidrug resistance protein
VHSLSQALIARGAPPPAAARMAVGALYQIVQRQASMMAFIDVFWALALFIAVILPIVFLLKRTPLEREHSPRGEPATSHSG